jgi:sugar-specific transcriptional regulator TrmB
LPAMEPALALQQAGLSGNEVKVYLALIHLGSALAGKITKNCGVNRTNVYDALDRLMEKGLITYVVQANRKYFECADLSNITRYLQDLEQDNKRKQKLIARILPDLEKQRTLAREPLEAAIYKGKRGLQSVAEDVLASRKTMYVFGAEGKFVSVFKHYAAQWHARRAAMRLRVNIIYNETIRDRKIKAPFRYFHMRFSNEMDDTPATTWIYGDKVAIVVWSDPIVATLIRSSEVSKSYRQFFGVLWKGSAP